jgi:hypothetical protein
MEKEQRWNCCSKKSNQLQFSVKVDCLEEFVISEQTGIYN